MFQVLFNSGDFSIQTVYVFILLFLISYVLIFWTVTRDTLKQNTIFDITLITLIIGIVSARLLGMLASLQEYLEAGWSLLPVSEIDGTIAIAAQLPWSFIRLIDGNVSYIGLFLGLVLGMIFIYQNSNQKKTVYILFDQLFVSYAIASIFLLIGIFMHGADIGAREESGLLLTYPDGTMRYPIQLMQIGLTILFLLLVWVLRSSGKLKPGLIASSYLIMFGISEFLLRTLTAQYSASLYGVVDLYQLVALVLTASGVILAVTLALPERSTRQIPQRQALREPIQQPPSGNRDISKERQKRARERQQLYDQQHAQSDRQTDAGNRFVVSFADRLRGGHEEE